MLIEREIPRVPQGYPVIPAQRAPAAPLHVTYYDAGGSGDCFLRALYRSLDSLGRRDVYRVSEVYRELGIPPGTYLEDTHISRLCALFGVNISVLRVGEGALFLSSFDCGSSTTVYVLNFFPLHFCPVTRISTLDSGTPWGPHDDPSDCLVPFSHGLPDEPTRLTRLIQEDTPPHPRILTVENRIVYDVSYLYSFGDATEPPLESTSDQHATEPAESSVSGNCTLPPSPCAPEVMYAYLLDSNSMLVPDGNHAIEVFLHVHNIFIRMLSELNETGHVPHSSMMKAYYKFRHNIFACLCRLSLGAEPAPLETDVPLSTWLPDSKKTPDFIVSKDDSLMLYEFTVGNTYERVDYLKGGGNRDIKYASECREIQSTGKRCSVVIVAAVLDSYNMEEVMLQLDSRSEEEALRMYFEIANTNKDVVSSNMVKSDNFSSMPPPESPGLELYPRPPQQDIVLVPNDVLSAVATDFSELMGMLETRNDYFNVSIVFDTDKMRYKVDRAKRGKRPSEWIQTLNPSPSKLIPNIRFRRDGKPVSFRKLGGTVPVTVFAPRRESRFEPWYETASFDALYLNTVPVYKPGYGEPEYFTEANVHHITDSQPVCFPPDYFDLLCTMKVEPLLACKSRKMLYNCKMDMQEIDNSMVLFEDSMAVNNVIDVYRPKPTFLLAFPSETLTASEVQVPEELARAYLRFGKGLYTKEVLRRAVEGRFATTRKTQFNAELRGLYESYHSANSSYYKRMMSLCHGMKKFRDLNAAEKQELKPLRDTVKAESKAYRSFLGKGKAVLSDRLVKLHVGSQMQTSWDSEMQHYNRSEGRAAVGFYSNHSGLHDYFTKLLRRMVDTNFCSTRYRDLFTGSTSKGSPFLDSQKQDFQKRYRNFYDSKLHGTLLMQLCHFVERVSKFLFNESLKTYNNDYVKIDNLGYSNILIMVRGGAKLYKHQRSRLYRIFFPIAPEDLKYSGYGENDSYEIFDHDSRKYVATPWSQVHQDVLFDYMFAPERVFNQLFSVCSRLDNSLERDIEPLSVFPSLLLFHNRRKTETLLHNSRYLIVNPLGFSANLCGIMPSFAGTNYTYLDTWLRHRISDHYRDFAASMMQIRDSGSRRLEETLDKCGLVDLWVGEPLVKPDLLTLFIYSTYMMTKAPVNSSLEQAANLWEILSDVKEFSENHADVHEMDDKSLRFDVTNFDESVYHDDFKYDPVFSEYLGFYMANYLAPKLSIGELSNKWDSIVSRDIDTCATSKGLRGYNASNFFNRKGYDIMYSKVNELLSDDEIQTRIEGYLQADHATAAQAIQADKMSFGGYDKDYESLVFHIVHKIQRGGSREIFCMDLNTKVIQSPVETFFTHLCKKVPNEFISVPSGKRHGRIHSDFYEKKVGRWVKNVVRWVLDCRRWAPHSVFQKYIHFINGMSHILPSAFLEHFYSMSKGMMGKKFITREHVMSKIRNNKRFEPYKNLIKPLDGIANAVYMSVKFSFVMGIFNYLSTLMHASNQLVAAEVVRNQCLNRGMGLVILDAKCHSDDSVVSSYHEDRKSVELSAKLYDWLLKGANHMLSVKKSQLNDDVYLEFLSTLYVMDRFLPVFPKFVSTLPFKPSDRGLMSDVSFSVSQAIELMTIGGSFEEAYLLMKTTDNAVRRIYNIPAIEGLPPQLFGDVDAHPVELLVSGSNADLYNFYRYNTEKFWNVYNTLAAQGLVDLEDISFSFSWDMGAMLDNNITKRIRDMSPIMEKLHDAQWTIRNCKLGNSSINLLWYYLKMQDRKFRSALVDEPVARRMSRIFGSAGYRRLQKSDGSLVEVSKVHAVLQYGDLLETNSYPTFTDEYLQFMSKELADLHSSLSDTSVTSQQPMGVKEKPITLVLNSPSLGSGNLSASEFVSYVKEPVGYKLLGRFRNPAREVERLRQELSIYNIKVDDCSPEMLYSVSRKLMGKEQHIYHMVAAVPSGLRYLNSYTHILQLLSTGTYAHRKLVLKNSTAAGIDWEKKLVAGRMPDSAREYIKSFWLCQTLDKASLLDKDIYTVNPRDTEHESAQRLPDEWKVILLTSVMQRHLPLSQINHWIYWEKEQIRLGHSWVGTGICVVKLPEATIRVTMASGSCRKVEVCTSHGGLISQSSSWFLHNVLQHGAVSAQFYDKSLALPNQHYLGVVSNSCIYGFGGASQFDMIYDVEWTEADPIPSEFYTELKCDRVRNHYVYRGSDKDYYIDFFVPVSDPVSISFKGVFDPVKLKEYSDDEAVSDFIKKLSVDLGGLMEIDFTHMLDNLGSSTIYHIMYEGPARQAVLEGQPAEDAMVSAFAGWKKTHPDFGYPDEDQVERLYKDPESPPFPKLVMDHLLRIGKTNMNDSEFQAILIHLTGLSKEDREVYLASNFGFLDKRMRTEAMVMVSRSKLVFKTCALIGGDALKLLVPFVCAVRNSMASNSIISSTLESMRKTLYFSRKIKMSSKNLFFLIACKCIYDGLAGRSNQQLSLSYSRLQTVLCELWENGLGFYLNTTPYDDPRMRTIDFSIGTEEMKAWLDDLVSAHYNYNYRLKLSTTTQRMLRGKEDVESLLGPCRSQILRFNSLNTPPSITVVTKKKTEILKYQEPTPGLTMRDFGPLTEDDTEELMCSIEMDDDETIEELEIDDSIEIPSLAYTSCREGSFYELTGCRGTAWNVFVKCPTISPDVRKIQPTMKIFKKTHGFATAQEYLENSSGYIVYMGVDNIRCTIDGYKELSFEMLVRELRLKNTYERVLVSDGISYKRSEIKKNALLQSSMLTVDQYFKRVSKELVEEEVALVNERVSKFPLTDSSSEISKCVEELNQLLHPVEVEDHVVDFAAIFERYMGAVSVTDEAPAAHVREYIRANYSMFNYSEPLSVLTDMVTKSELNCIFPGYVDSIISGDVKLSKQTKKRIIRYATLEVSDMPRMLQKKYRKLLFLVKTVLNDVSECNYMQNEDLEFAARVDALFAQGREPGSDDDSPLDLIPETLDDKIKFDLSKIL